MRADLAAKALSKDSDDGGRDKVRLHAHIHHSDNGGGCVVGVQGGEHQVAGQRGLDSDFGGLQVAHFADHDDVRVLAQERPKRVCERETRLLVHLHLGHAGELILHGVLDSDDVLLDGVQLVEHGVLGGGFARTGGTGGEHHAVRLGDKLLQLRLGLRRKAELAQTDQNAALVQDAADNLLTEDVRQTRDAKVVILVRVTVADGDAAVLRNAALGDVHLRHDLETGDERGLDVLRQLHGLVEHAVHAVAHAHMPAVRLQVDIGGAFVDGLQDHRIGHAHDGSLLGHRHRRLVILGNLSAGARLGHVLADLGHEIAH